MFFQASRLQPRREAASRIQGTCTAEVIDADLEAEEPYLVTEFVEGPTLDLFIEANGPLHPTLTQSGFTCRAACACVSAATQILIRIGL